MQQDRQRVNTDEQITTSLQILHDKLQFLSGKLSAADHPEDIRAVCAAIKECGLAISALMGVTNKNN